MEATYVIFAAAVAIAVAWMFAVSRFIEPEMRRSCWSGDSPQEPPSPKDVTPKKAAQIKSSDSARNLARRTPAHG